MSVDTDRDRLAVEDAARTLAVDSQSLQPPHPSRRTLPSSDEVLPMSRLHRRPRALPSFDESPRVAIYLQAVDLRPPGSNLSISEQRARLNAFCSDKAWAVVGEYAEPNASVSGDHRPAFQGMIEQACGDAHPFDVILVHSLSQTFGEGEARLTTMRRLCRARVRWVSIVREADDDPPGTLIGDVIARFDEYRSRHPDLF